MIVEAKDEQASFLAGRAFLALAACGACAVLLPAEAHGFGEVGCSASRLGTLPSRAGRCRRRRQSRGISCNLDHGAHGKPSIGGSTPDDGATAFTTRLSSARDGQGQ